MITPLTFFGSDEYSAIVLTHLLKDENTKIVSVITDPGRDNPVETLAKEHDLPLISFPALKDSSKDLLAPLGVLASFGHILDQSVINLFPSGILCLHPSLLPQYRGATPAPHAIALGDKATGITLFTLSSKVDQGEIISQQEEPILPEDTTPTLLTRLFTLGSNLLISHLSQPTRSLFVGIKLDHPPIFTRRFSRQSGFISWDTLLTMISGTLPDASMLKSPLLKLRLTNNPPQSPLTALHDLIRALTPWPGVWTTAPTKKGEMRLVITSAKPEVMVKLPGKPKPISWSDFTKYYRK